MLSFGHFFASLPVSSLSDNPQQQVKEPLAFIRKAQVHYVFRSGVLTIFLSEIHYLLIILRDRKQTNVILSKN